MVRMSLVFSLLFKKKTQYILFIQFSLKSTPSFIFFRFWFGFVFTIFFALAVRALEINDEQEKCSIMQKCSISPHTKTKRAERKLEKRSNNSDDFLYYSLTFWRVKNSFTPIAFLYWFNHFHPLRALKQSKSLQTQSYFFSLPYFAFLFIPSCQLLFHQRESFSRERELRELREPRE